MRFIWIGPRIESTPIREKFAVYFDSTVAASFSEEPVDKLETLFNGVAEKHQELEEGWLPVLVTRWSQSDVSFERTDWAALHCAADPLDASKLMGNELALMISRLRIRNEAPVAKMARYSSTELLRRTVLSHSIVHPTGANRSHGESARSRTTRQLISSVETSQPSLSQTSDSKRETLEGL
jgi:hypothetical protein